MAVARMPVAVLLLLGAASAAPAQDPAPIFPAPAARLAPPPGTATLAEPRSAFADPAPVLPPLLPVPAQVAPPRRPCLPCQTEYQPNHVYLPEANPDCGAGGCDGECHECRRWWVNLSFMLGFSQDQSGLQRGLECGTQGGAGYWFSPADTLGLDFRFVNVHQPYHAVQVNAIINSPLTVTTADPSFRIELLNVDHYRLDGLVGYRYTYLHENLFVLNANAPGSVQDMRNNIHAADLGAMLTWKYGAYFCEVLGRVGLGRNSETLNLNGVSTTHGEMAVVPEFSARVGYQLGEGVYGTLGYTFLYANHVARPNRPDGDFYVHGLTAGIECRF